MLHIDRAPKELLAIEDSLKLDLFYVESGSLKFHLQHISEGCKTDKSEADLLIDKA